MRTRLALTLVAVLLAAPATSRADMDLQIIGDALFASNDDTPAFAQVSIRPGTLDYRVDNVPYPLYPVAPCKAAGPPNGGSVADCPAAGLFTLVLVLGDNPDRFGMNAGILLDVVGAGRGADDSIFTADGDDTLVGNAGNDELNGGAGDDTLSDGDPGGAGGAGGNDSFFGAQDDDVLDGGRFASVVDEGSGADVMNGGAGGHDTADYSARTQPLTITEDGSANDGQQVGAASEGDNVTGAETVLGGSAGDRITGGPEPNVLRGTDGADLLDGGDSTDVLLGGPGIDTATYPTRNAHLVITLDELPNDGVPGENDDVETENATGGAGADSLTGSSGANVLEGAAGGDTISGLGGDDTIQARDQTKDTIKCGTGVDTVVADAVDSVAADCEKVSGKPKPPKPKPKLKIGKQALLAKGRLRVKVSAGAVCSGGSLVVKSVGNQVGSRAFSLPVAGKQRAFKVKVGSALKGRKRARVRATCPGLVAAARKVKIKRPG